MDEAKFEWFAAHVKSCLEVAYEEETIPVDDDGDWMIGVNGRTVFVQAAREPVWHARLFTVVAEAVSPLALGEINELNAMTVVGKLIRTDTGQVVMTHVLHADAVTPTSLRHAFAALGSVSSDVGEMLSTVYAPETHVSKVAPPVIRSLPDNGIFVFGSGKTGQHRAGAAGHARTCFGAVPGVREGLRGHSYAIPSTAGFETFAEAAQRFLMFAGSHPELEFWMSRVGCGKANLPEPHVAALFADAPANVIKPAGW